jgi:hypothetical protein
MATKQEISAALTRAKAVAILSLGFRTTLSSPPDRLDSNTSVQADPCATVSDASSVLKAQTTKLGLLLVNKPLTPSALANILEDLEVRVLPSLYGYGTYIYARSDIYGGLFSSNLATALLEIVSSLLPVMEVIEKAVKGEGVVKNNVMFLVGKVYSAADGAISLATKGVTSVLFTKVKGLTALMNDAHEELVDWREDMDDETNDDDDDSEDEDAESVKEKADSLEEMVSGLSISDQNKLPGHREDLIRLLAESLRRIELISMLCTAIAKRRIRKFPFKAPPYEHKEEEKTKVQQMLELNQVVRGIEEMQGEVDEIAGSFYELSNSSVVRHLSKLTTDAVNLAELTAPTWEAKTDDFTEWAETWKKLINQNILPPLNAAD